MTIGEKIRKARKTAKMSQKDISARTGFAVNTISRYENGERIPNIEAIAKFAAALGVDISELTKDICVPSFESVETYEQNEQTDYAESCLNGILSDFDKLNTAGKKTAAERVHELTLIKQYTEPDGQEPPF